MLPNEEFALACRAYYEEQGLIVDKTNGQFAHSPLTRKECNTGYYLLWEHHQHQGLLQSKDLNKCCFFAPDTKKWLLTADYFPDDFFELWNIYDQYSGWSLKNMSPLTRSKAIENRTKGLREFFSKLSFEEKKKRTAHLQTPEMQQKKGEAVSKALNSRSLEKRKSHAQKRVASLRKRVEITFPSGRVGVYPSVAFAATATGIRTTCISRWAISGKTMSEKKYKGFSARYL